MKSTLADIRQLFNVKAIAYNTNINALAEGQFGIFPEDSDVSVASGTVYSTLPAKFRIVSKLNGKLYFSLDTIEKTRMFNQKAKAYQTEQINIWEGVINYCNCIDGVTLNVNIDEQSLIQRDGLTWTHKDFVVVVSPQELKCFCNCDGTKPVYENNILTQLLAQKVNAINSPYYEASVGLATLTGLVTYANQGALDTAVPTPVAGALAIVTGAGVKQYNGTAWVVVATVTGAMTDAQVVTFIAVNKTLNTDDDATNDGAKLKLILKGKLQGTGVYRDLDVNYVFPRGVKLSPSISINNEVAVGFTQTQELRYELGAGRDLRAEEFEYMSLYTTLNFYPRLSDGIASPDLVYQFENATNYSTVTLEFGSKKSGLEDVPEGDYKKFGLLLATSVGGVYTDLQALFIP